MSLKHKHKLGNLSLMAHTLIRCYHECLHRACKQTSPDSCLRGVSAFINSSRVIHFLLCLKLELPDRQPPRLGSVLGVTLRHTAMILWERARWLFVIKEGEISIDFNGVILTALCSTPFAWVWKCFSVGSEEIMGVGMLLRWAGGGTVTVLMEQ